VDSKIEENMKFKDEFENVEKVNKEKKGK